MTSDKELLRIWLKSKRISIGDEHVNVFSSSINHELIKLLEKSSLKKVHIYSQIEALKEVKTTELVNYFKNQNIEIFISTPSPYAVLPNEKFDLIIVPTLGFDSRGNRIGWGGGYYDKLLAQQTGAIKIGLSYQNGYVAKGLPTESHDIPLNIIITESNIYKF